MKALDKYKSWLRESRELLCRSGSVGLSVLRKLDRLATPRDNLDLLRLSESVRNLIPEDVILDMNQKWVKEFVRSCRAMSEQMQFVSAELSAEECVDRIVSGEDISELLV